jgi:hypothetical protein
MDIDERIEHAIKHTEVIRSPKRTLATFGVTTIYYYLITKLIERAEETVIRDGRVIAERPKIVTPAYLTYLEGFGENARRYIEKLTREYPHASGLYYAYRNEPKEINIVSEPPEAVIYKLNEKIEQEKNPLTAIIKGIDELWDISLLKFIAELTEHSVRDNLIEFSRRGLLGVDEAGVTRDARYIIEQLFEQAGRDLSRVSELKLELDRWCLFPEYEDRFLNLFRRA